MTLKQLFSTIYPTDFGIFVSAVDELVVSLFCYRLFQASPLDVDRVTITMKFHKCHGSL